VSLSASVNNCRLRVSGEAVSAAQTRADYADKTGYGGSDALVTAPEHVIVVKSILQLDAVHQLRFAIASCCSLFHLFMLFMNSWIGVCEQMN
jgi:hypothetical protein